MYDEKVGPLSADHKEYLGDILTSSRHLLQLINDVLDLAKVESGTLEFHPERVDLQTVVGEVRDVLRTIAAHKRIQITCEVEPSLGEIVIDPAKLKQVLYNYLSNALKFTPDEGTVAVRVRAEDDTRFRIEVKDSGIGIREEDLHRLFVEFQQLDASTGKRYQGTGLGLALTRRIVEAQGGETGVTTTPGAGSTFFAVLLRTAGDAAPPTNPRASRASRESQQQKSILVVEDDAKERAWIVATLTGAGYVVEAVTTGSAAIRAAEEQSFDAVTLDLLLPDMSGWDVLRAIRAGDRNPDVAAFVLTVVAEKGVGIGFVVHDFLTKPVAADALAHALQRIGTTRSEVRSVLIIDDDPNAARLVEPTLRAHGYEVVAVPDGLAGLQAVRSSRPYAVVLDLFMSGMDGFEFLHKFRLTEYGRTTPVIVWTVKDLSRAERLRLQASAQAILTKEPGSTEALLAELDVHIGRSKRGSDVG
jgi:CheY-like chemotaxis protein/two-component sensor histidine kinase